MTPLSIVMSGEKLFVELLELYEKEVTRANVEPARSTSAWPC